MVAETPQWNTLEQMKQADCACPWVSREQAHNRLLDTEAQTLERRCDGHKDVQGTHGKKTINTQVVDELSHPDEVDKGAVRMAPLKTAKEREHAGEAKMEWSGRMRKAKKEWLQRQEQLKGPNAAGRQRWEDDCETWQHGSH